jgi:hypothetical protein
MSLWMRYETQHERAFQKCLAELRKRKERRKAEKHETAVFQRAEGESRDEAALSQRAEDSTNVFERQKLRKEENTRAQEANGTTRASDNPQRKNFRPHSHLGLPVGNLQPGRSSMNAEIR